MSISSLPGPPSRFLIGNLPELKKDRLGFFTDIARQYGDIAAFKIGPLPAVLLTNPDDIQAALTNSNDFRKNRFLRAGRVILGDGLLLSEDDLWLRQRRLSQPAFHRDRIHGYGRISTDYTLAKMAEWHDGETRDFHDEMLQLTMGIVAKALFDAEIGGHESREICEGVDLSMALFEKQQRSICSVFGIPTIRNIQARLIARRVDNVIYRIIKNHKEYGEDFGDLLSLFIQIRDEEDGTGMTDKQMRDEVITLFFAGYETTALTLTWAFYLIGQFPQAEERLVSELRNVLGERVPTVEDLPQLRYAEKVIKEALRLYPPSYNLVRELRTDSTIGDHTIPKGTMVAVSQWVMHRDPRFFTDPEEFQPERWTDSLTDSLHRYAYFPFGGGQRMCIGAGFAMMEATLVMVTILQRFSFSLVDGQCVVPNPALTLRPQNGVKVILRERTVS